MSFLGFALLFVGFFMPNMFGCQLADVAATVGEGLKEGIQNPDAKPGEGISRLEFWGSYLGIMLGHELRKPIRKFLNGDKPDG